MSEKQETMELANYQERLGAAYSQMMPYHARGCYKEAAWLYRSVGEIGMAQSCEAELQRIRSK